MALNYTKQRNRDLAAKALRLATDERAYAAELAGGGAEPSKAQLRAEAAALLAQYRRPVRVVARKLRVKCRCCGHEGVVRLLPGKALPKFRCSRCGAAGRTN
jgi:ribosomal protein S27E